MMAVIVVEVVAIVVEVVMTVIEVVMIMETRVDLKNL
jgi:hypothetical protein